MAAVISKETWDAIKLASVKGMSDEDISMWYGVKVTTIGVARHRDPMWSAAVSKRTNARKNTLEAVRKGNHDQNLALTLHENAASLNENNKLLALKAAGRGLERAFDKSGVLHQHLRPESLNDLKTLTDIAAKAGSWSSEQAVTVNCQAWASVSAPMAVSGDPDQIGGESDNMGSIVDV
jgi:hypothetical protein